jgi:hypothetical protein
VAGSRGGGDAAAAAVAIIHMEAVQVHGDDCIVGVAGGITTKNAF